MLDGKVEGGLLEIVEQADLVHFGRGGDGAVVGGLSLGHVGGCGCSIAGDKGVLVGSDVELFLAEVVLVGGDFVDGVAIEDAGGAQCVGSTIDAGAGGGDAGGIARLQGGDQGLQGGKNIGAALGKNAAAGKVGVDRETGSDLHLILVIIADVGDRTSRGVGDVWGGSGGGSGKQVLSGIGSVGERENLALDAGDLLRDGVEVALVHGSIGSLDGESGSPLQSGDDGAQCAIGGVERVGERAGTGGGLIGGGGARVLVDHGGFGSGIVGGLVDAASGAEFLKRFGLVGLSLVEQADNVGSVVGIDAQGLVPRIGGAHVEQVGHQGIDGGDDLCGSLEGALIEEKVG